MKLGRLLLGGVLHQIIMLATFVLICSESHPDLQNAVMEVHGVRAQLREGSEDPALAVSDAVYMKHFSSLLDEWLDQAPFE